jgi:glycogen debranching enzyme
MEHNMEYWNIAMDKKVELDIGFCQTLNGKKNPLATKLTKNICSKLIVKEDEGTESIKEEKSSEQQTKIKENQTNNTDLSEYFSYRKRPEWMVHRQTKLIFNTGKRVIGRLEIDEDGYEFLEDLSKEDIDNCRTNKFEIEY